MNKTFLATLVLGSIATTSAFCGNPDETGIGSNFFPNNKFFEQIKFWATSGPGAPLTETAKETYDKTDGLAKEVSDTIQPSAQDTSSAPAQDTSGDGGGW